MNQQPLVTVVIPTWNRLPFVEEAALSVIAQTYGRWELVVIDDGSTDGTADRLAALGDPRIRVFSSPRRRHIGQLRNRGAMAGSGELIAFLDSDDIWLPRKLEVQIDALRETGAGWCYSGFETVDAAGRAIPMRSNQVRLFSGDIVRDLLISKPTIRTSTVVVRRDVFEAAGRFSEDPRLLFGEDHELFLRLALRAHAATVSETLMRFREHPGRTSAGNADSHGLLALIYELFLAGAPDSSHAPLARRLRARAFADAGAMLLSAGKLGRAAQSFGRSARHGADIRDWGRALARGIRDGVVRRNR